MGPVTVLGYFAWTYSSSVARQHVDTLFTSGFLTRVCYELVSIPNGRLTNVMMDLPTSNDQYAMKDYWDERYTEEDNYEWFAKYESFAHLIIRSVNRPDRILQLGMPFLSSLLTIHVSAIIGDYC